MGNSESSPDGGAAAYDDFDGIETLGYRVLGVQPNSPASAAGLVSFFDFLIGANGEMLLGSGEELQEGEEYDDVDFPSLLDKYKGKSLQLLVWNIKSQEQRLVDICPNDDWEGAGLLGVTIRLDNYAGAEDRLIRILSVEHNSPAAIAGLVPSQDYLLGTTTHSFDSTKVLAVVLEAHVDRVVELYVYNTSSDKVRVVALMPTWSWGGNGLLGAEVGTGYLHRLPGSCRSTLGGSVERRVRWIGGNAPTSPQLQQQAALEMEPQLEMELDPHHHEQITADAAPAPAKGPPHVIERAASIGTVSLTSQTSFTQQEQATSNHQETLETNTTSENVPATTMESRTSVELHNITPVTSQTTDNANPSAANTTADIPPEPSRSDEALISPPVPNTYYQDSVAAASSKQQDDAPAQAPVPAPFPVPAPNQVVVETVPPEEIAQDSSVMPPPPHHSPKSAPPQPLANNNNNTNTANGATASALELSPSQPPQYGLSAASSDSMQPAITTFIPAVPPPPGAKPVAAKDLFSGPPPRADKIPSKSGVGTPDSDRNLSRRRSGSRSRSHSPPPAFATPHPPSAEAVAASTSTRPPYYVSDTTTADMLPPPPTMSGAR